MMVKNGFIVTGAANYQFQSPQIDRKSMYFKSMRVLRAAKKVLALNIRKPRSSRSIVIQVFPHVINALHDPPTLHTAEQMLESVAIFDSVSLAVQIGIVLIGKKIF